MIPQKLHACGMFLSIVSTMLMAQVSISEDSAKANMNSLKNPQAILSILSSPTRAEIYIDKKPGKKTSPDAYTPAILKIKKTQMNLTLFKKGYSDTTLQLNLAPATTNAFNIFMVPLDVQTLIAQNQFLRERFHVKLGKLCFISSPIFIAAGAGCLYYSDKSKRRADEARSFLDNTIIPSGPEFDAMNKKYTNETRKKNLALITGIVMFGLAAVDLGAGIILYF